MQPKGPDNLSQAALPRRTAALGGPARLWSAGAKYGRVYLRLAWMSFGVQASHPVSSFGYLVGKLARIGFFLVFLTAIFRHTPAIAGYSLQEAALFFLTFNIVDILGQLFFRGVYGIRSLIREGDLDYFLIQPANVLFRICFNTVDFLDVVTILPVLGVTGYLVSQLSPSPPLSAVGLFALLIFNGLIIALAFHIAVASVAVLTQELENTVWIYRDLMTLGRFPADIYSASVRWVLTFLIPVAVMITVPAKAMLGRLSAAGLAQALLVAAVTLGGSLWFWRYATARYTSVSS